MKAIRFTTTKTAVYLYANDDEARFHYRNIFLSPGRLDADLKRGIDWLTNETIAAPEIPGIGHGPGSYYVGFLLLIEKWGSRYMVTRNDNTGVFKERSFVSADELPKLMEDFKKRLSGIA